MRTPCPVYPGESIIEVCADPDGLPAVILQDGSVWRLRQTEVIESVECPWGERAFGSLLAAREARDATR